MLDCAASLGHGHCVEQAIGQDRRVLYIRKVRTALLGLLVKSDVELVAEQCSGITLWCH